MNKVDSDHFTEAIRATLKRPIVKIIMSIEDATLIQSGFDADQVNKGSHLNHIAQSQARHLNQLVS